MLKLHLVKDQCQWLDYGPHEPNFFKGIINAQKCVKYKAYKAIMQLVC